jgi:hypothetical protein
MNRSIRAAIAAILMCSIVPTPAFGLLFGPIPILPPKTPPIPLTLAKPALPAHEDAPPPFAGEAGVVSAEPESGTVDPAEAAGFDEAALAAEDAVAEPATHEVDSSSSYGCDSPDTAAGDGRNGISFGRFQDGDIVVVLEPWSLGHAGIFDRSAYASIYSYAVISANVTPFNGVQREQCVRYRAYDRAYALWVPSQAHHRTQARLFAQRQVGKPYVLSPNRYGTTTFYCSKLAWSAWYYTAHIDLDGDGGAYVWPVDLVTSRNTRLFGYWN